MRRNVAGQFVGCQLIAKADGTPITAGTTTVYVTGDAGTQGAGSVSSGACAHEGNGYWTYAPAQAETNYTQVAFTFVNTNAINATVQLYPIVYGADGVLSANLAQILGTALTETAGLLAAAFKKFFNVATPTGTVNSLPDAVPGASGGGLIAGTNASLTITGALTVSDGVVVNAASTNRAGMAIQGNGTAPGLYVAGGATADGFRAESGVSGTGLAGISAVGHGTAGIGLKAVGAGTGAGLSTTGGATGDGMLTTGGATSGAGLKATAPTLGVGIDAGGAGTDGHGISAHAGGGVSANGIQAVGGSGLIGDGIHALATSSNGVGLSAQGNGGGPGLLAIGGASGDGIRGFSPTAGNGMSLEGIGGSDLLLSTPTTNADDATLAAISAVKSDTAAIKLSTDNLPSDPADESLIIAAVGSVASQISALKDFDPATDTVARVTLVDTCTVNTDMRGTDGANTTTPPTVGAIADKVWDEAITDHLGLGSTGLALSGAASAGDPWLTPIPGLYGPGTAGSIIGTNLDVAVSTRAVPADVPTAIENADALLNRDMSVGLDSGTKTIRTVRQALRFLRNKWSIAGATLTVTKEDDATKSWEQTLSTTPGADPVTGVDPEGP